LQRAEAETGGGEDTFEAVGLQEILHAVDGDGETGSDGRAVLEAHADDADRIPPVVEHGAAAAARVDGGVGLDVARVAPPARAQGADGSAAHRGLRHGVRRHRSSDLHRASEREPDHLHRLAGSERVRVAEREEGQVAAADGEHGEVEVGTGRLHPRLQPRAVGGEDDLHPRDLDPHPDRHAVALHGDVFTAHDVFVREDVSGRGDHEPAARRHLDLARLDRLLPAAFELGVHHADHADEHGGVGG
jgi:hypothetical protein